MKTRSTIILVAVAVAVAALAFAGCSGGDKTPESAREVVETAAKDMGDAAQNVGEAASDMAAKVEGAVANVADLVPKQGETMLVGTMGCGHCNFGIGDSCAAAMKTADGTVYIMEGVGAGHVLFDERKSEKPIQVVGVVDTKDGVQYVKVREFHM